MKKHMKYGLWAIGVMAGLGSEALADRLTTQQISDSGIMDSSISQDGKTVKVKYKSTCTFTENSHVKFDSKTNTYSITPEGTNCSHEQNAADRILVFAVNPQLAFKVAVVNNNNVEVASFESDALKQSHAEQDRLKSSGITSTDCPACDVREAIDTAKKYNDPALNKIFADSAQQRVKDGIETATSSTELSDLKDALNKLLQSKLVDDKNISAQDYQRLLRSLAAKADQLARVAESGTDSVALLDIAKDAYDAARDYKTSKFYEKGSKYRAEVLATVDADHPEVAAKRESLEKELESKEKLAKLQCDIAKDTKKCDRLIKSIASFKKSNALVLGTTLPEATTNPINQIPAYGTVQQANGQTWIADGQGNWLKQEDFFARLNGQNAFQNLKQPQGPIQSAYNIYSPYLLSLSHGLLQNHTNSAQTQAVPATTTQTTSSPFQI